MRPPRDGSPPTARAEAFLVSVLKGRDASDAAEAFAELRLGGPGGMPLAGRPVRLSFSALMLAGRREFMTMVRVHHGPKTGVAESIPSWVAEEVRHAARAIGLGYVNAPRPRPEWWSGATKGKRKKREA